MQRETWILERGFLTVGENGMEEVHLQAGWHSYLRTPQERILVPAKKLVYFPHTDSPMPLPVDSELVSKWCRALKGVGEFRRDVNCQDAWQRYPKSMQAAKELESLTGLVVGEDSQWQLDTNCGVW